MRRFCSVFPLAVLLALAFTPAAVSRGISPGTKPFCAAVPRADWLSYPEIELKLKEVGYQLLRLRLADDRCYTVSVRDGSGGLLNLIVHPVTAEIVSIRK